MAARSPSVTRWVRVAAGSSSLSLVAWSARMRATDSRRCASAWARAPPSSWSASMADAASSLRVERAPDRVVVTLDRPAARNAIDQDLVDALHAVCAELEADPRVLIIAGAGGV